MLLCVFTILFGLVTPSSAALKPVKFWKANEFNEEISPLNTWNVSTDPEAVINIRNGNWIKFSSFDFGTGFAAAHIEASCPTDGGCTIRLRTGSKTGPIIGSVVVTPTGSGWGNYKPLDVGLLASTTGVHDLYFTFEQAPGLSNLCNVRNFWFSRNGPNLKMANSNIQATLFDQESHPSTAPVVDNNGVLDNLMDGTWVAYTGFQFGTDANHVEIEAGADGKAGAVELRTGSAEGPVIGVVDINYTGSMSFRRVFSASLSQPQSGIQNLYLRFVNSNGAAAGTSLFTISRLSVFNLPTPPAPAASQNRLGIYQPVPGLIESPYYRFSVQKVSEMNAPLAQNNTNWRTPFALFTKCVDYSPEVHDLPPPSEQETRPAGWAYFAKYIGSWSHTYCNFELDRDTPIVVKITRMNEPGAPSGPITKASARPAQNVIACEWSGNDVYVTLSKPCQIAVDIDGQMDGRDAPRNIPDAWNDATAPFNDKATGVHAVTIFANPFIEDKPLLGGPGVLAVEPGQNVHQVLANAASAGTIWNTLYFKPGIHNFTVGTQWSNGDVLVPQDNKQYYIPGDAIVYGNLNDKKDMRVNKNIRIFGHGTLSGEKIPHYFELPRNEIQHIAMAALANVDNCHFEGITVANPAEFGLKIDSFDGGWARKQSSIRWVKNISWRVNNDGLTATGNGLIEDCFLRHQDDAIYVNGATVRRVVFWSDVNGIPLRCDPIVSSRSGSFPIWRQFDEIVEDCEIIYARSVFGGKGVIEHPETPSGESVTVNSSYDGGVWNQGQHVVFRNIIVSDPRPQRTMFNFGLQNSAFRGWAGIRFENIEYRYPNAWGDKVVIHGTADGPAKFYTFDNVTISGVPLDADMFSDPNRFETVNANAGEMIFKVAPNIHKTLTTPISVLGTINRSPISSLYVSDTEVKLTAVPIPGYVFSSWSGDLAGSANPATIKMDANKTVAANYTAKPVLTQLSALGWSATASNNNGGVGKALDASAATRWDTGSWQTPGQWFQVDLGSSQTFDTLELDTAESPNDSPIGYSVGVSNDGIVFTPVATGQGVYGMTTIKFALQVARYIRVTQTGSSSVAYWSIHDFRVYYSQLTGSLNRTGWTAKASAGGNAFRALDGAQSSRWTTNAHQAPGQWFEVDMKSLKVFKKIILDTEANSGDSPSGYEVQIRRSTTESWQQIATGSGMLGATTISFDNSQTARFIRINQTGSPAPSPLRWWSITEFQVYAPDVIPSPWQTADIGTVSASGTGGVTRNENAIWTIRGSGASTMGTSDSFRFVYRSVTGDCEILARVTGVQQTSAASRAGIMIRESTEPNAKYAFICLKATNGVQSQARRTITGIRVKSDTASQTLTSFAWVKLVRSGDTFTASYSHDGATWNTLDTTTITMGQTVNIGLAVCSHWNGQLCTSTMDNVIVTTP